MLETAVIPLHGFKKKNGLCDDEPSPKVRVNKSGGNLWIFRLFSQCCVNIY